MTDSLDTSQVFKQADNCLTEELDGESLVYNPEQATTIHLDGPASLIWQLCTGENSVEDMISLVGEHFPEQAEQVRVDIVDTVAGLAKKNFLQLVS